MKKKKIKTTKQGFKLIELLAIIVILAIIAVITVPIILNIIENAKMGSAKDSAYGYKEAINKFYTSELLKNNNINLNGTYTVSDGTLTGIFDGQQIETKNIQISGAIPKQGNLVYDKNELKSGCITIGEYAITIIEGNPDTVKKGTCPGTENIQKPNTQSSDITTPSTNIMLINDNDNDNKASIGDYVGIGTDGFYVLNNDANGKTLLIAEYNLDSKSRQSKDNYINIKYYNEESSYWWDRKEKKYKSEYITESNSIFKEEYGYNGDREKTIAYIYRDKDGNETPNNLKTYLNTYKEYLSQTAPIEDVRLVSYEEVVMGGCGHDNNANTGVCPDWMANQTYWTGSAIDGRNSQLFMENNSSTTIDATSEEVNKKLVVGDCYYFEFGIRPLVVVSTTSIEITQS